MPSVFTQAKRHARITRKLHVSVARKALILLSIIGVVLYTMFFTTTPVVHDYFHQLRHSLMMIPCH
jgi:hypothetical protein